MTLRAFGADHEERCVQNFHVYREVLANGRYRAIIRNLEGAIIEDVEGANQAEVDRHMRGEGYQHIPSYIAYEIDSCRRCQ